MSGYGTATNDIHPRLSDAEMMANLRQENIKLRKLISDLYEMAWPEYPSAFESAFADRMRELGMEVKNGVEAQV